MKSVLFFGTSAATPTKKRNVTSHALIFLNGRAWMIDCGEGTQHRLLQSPLKPNKLDAIFITHMHGDHVFGLPGLLASLSLLSGERKDALKLFGPAGLKAFVDTSLSTSATYITYKIDIIELEEGKVHHLGRLNHHEVTAFPLIHKVPCFGYVVNEDDKPGVLDAKQASKLGAKGKQLGVLKGGKDVTLDDGTIIYAKDVLGAPQKGKTVVLLGDTSDSSSMLGTCQECDLLVHEVTYDAQKHQKAIEGGHSTSTMAGQFAKQLKAKKMVITHFSMRYTTSREEDNSAEEEGSGEKEELTVEDLVKETQHECTGTTVLAANDLQNYDV